MDMIYIVELERLVYLNNFIGNQKHSLKSPIIYFLISYSCLFDM
jgi:hypothetical protein